MSRDPVAKWSLVKNQNIKIHTARQPRLGIGCRRDGSRCNSCEAINLDDSLDSIAERVATKGNFLTKILQQPSSDWTRFFF